MAAPSYSLGPATELLINSLTGTQNLIFGTPKDCSDRYFVLTAEWGINSNSGVSFVATDSAGNFKRFDTNTNNRRKVYNYIFDLSHTPDSSSGVLNTSDIVEIDVINIGGGDYTFTLYLIDFLIANDGDSGNPITYLNTSQYFAGEAGLQLFTFGGDLIPIVSYAIGSVLDPHRFSIGNNTAALFNASNSGGIASIDAKTTGSKDSAWDSGVSGDNNNASVAGTFLGENYKQIIFNTTTAQTIFGSQISNKRVINLSAATITFSGWIISSPPGCDFGTGVVLGGNIFSSTQPIEGGSQYLNTLIADSTASWALDWNGIATFDNVSFTGVVNHYINCDGANFDNGATLDISTVTFGTPGIRKIRVNATGKTLNIETTGGFTIDDVTIVAGTVNIVAPTPTLTISGIPAGGIFTIWDDEVADPQDLGTALQTTDPTTGSDISYVGTAGNAVVYQFVPNTGASASFQEFNIPGVIPATSQTLDLSSSLEPETNI